MSRSSATDEVESVRRTAIDHHHDFTPVFEKHYQDMAQSRFTSAFTYGRHKVDVVMDRTLDRLPRSARVLDVGCGTGVYLRRYAAMGLTPVGLEPAPGMLEVARRDNPGVRVEQGVATELPFGDGEFDAVTEIEVLRYLHRDDVRRALTEARRVLRPGGILFVTMVNRWALDGFYVVERLRRARRGSSHDRRHPHCEFFEPDELEHELVRAGFVRPRTIGRLLAPIRLAYKVHGTLGSAIARRVETVDDRLHDLHLTKRFAGHLIAIAERPRVGEGE